MYVHVWQSLVAIEYYFPVPRFVSGVKQLVLSICQPLSFVIKNFFITGDLESIS